METVGASQVQYRALERQAAPHLVVMLAGEPSEAPAAAATEAAPGDKAKAEAAPAAAKAAEPKK